jgi:hypothetical protein
MSVDLQRQFNRLGVRGKRQFKGPVEDLVIGEYIYNTQK